MPGDRIMKNTLRFSLFCLIVALLLEHGDAEEHGDDFDYEYYANYEPDSIYDEYMANYHPILSSEITTPEAVISSESSLPKSNPEDSGRIAAGLECSHKSPSWIDLGGDFCYVIETPSEEDYITWTDAAYRCITEGGSLASFHSVEEVMRILKYLKDVDISLSIGLWKHADGALEWMDRTPLDFRYWHRGEPDYAENQCTHMGTRDMKWYDISCSIQGGYICSSPKDQPPRPESTKVCPDTSSKWRDFGGEACYIIEKDNHTTWDEALDRCTEEGGSLASFHSIEEVILLLQHTREYATTLHIGLRRGSSDAFQWVDRSPYDFDFWNSGEPNNEYGIEPCSEMYIPGGRWNDIPCSKPVGYVCSTAKVEPGTPTIENIQPPTSEVCGGDIRAEDGTISSWNFPGNYGANQNCFWKITVPEGHQVALHFRAIQLEYEYSCQFDYIKVLDGHDEDSSLLLRTCGSDLPQTVQSSGNQMAVIFVSDRVNEDSGFIADFTKVEPCGGSIVSEQGVIQSSNFPNYYFANQKCIWKIRVPDDNRIHLKFLEFETEGGRYCRYDYVEILDGHDSTSKVIGKFCGSDNHDILSSGHKITVIFTSDYLKEYHGFQAEFSIAEVTDTLTFEIPTEPSEAEVSAASCGGDIDAQEGFIVSPNYPDEYSAYQKCRWRITVPEGYQVVLRFKTFELEYNDDCSYDYVSVDDDVKYGGTLNKYCGSRIPDPITSSGNSISVVFETDSSGEYHGFSAMFSKVRSTSSGIPSTGNEELEEETLCGENITAEEGIIRSPNYPNNYGPNERCIWKLTVPQGYQISLKFSSFNVEIHDTCQYDHVEIREGHLPRGRVIAKLCGYDIPQDILSGSNKLHISLFTDSTSEYGGFSAEFKKVVAPTGTPTSAIDELVCGEDFHSDSGLVASPNFPENYPPLSECTWHITVPEGQFVRLVFTSFEVEYGPDCEFDYLKVFDGPGVDSPLLNRLCGSSDVEILRSSNNTMTVQFVTDDTLETRGFAANFSKGHLCGEDIVAGEGTIQSPNYPNNYETGEFCIWRITAPEDSTIVLKFLTLDVECSEDWVRVFEGDSDNNNMIGDFCGRDVPNDIYSRGNQITVQFSSNGFAQRQGFSAEFKEYKCGEDFVSDTGIITSPRYPLKYMPSGSCTWKITVPEGQKAMLIFNDFKLERCDNCACDYVEVRDGHETTSPSLGRFCGTSRPPSIRASTEKLSVRFRADGSVENKGFKAAFSADKCGEDFVSDTGIIESPGYPSGYIPRESCTWNITVSEGHRAVLTFQDISMETCDNCNCDYVEVRDGHEISSPLLGKFCSFTETNQVRASTEKMSVRFVTNGYVQYNGFKAEFSTDTSLEDEITAMLQEFPKIFGKQEHGIVDKPRVPLRSKRSIMLLKDLFSAMKKK